MNESTQFLNEFDKRKTQRMTRGASTDSADPVAVQSQQLPQEEGSSLPQDYQDNNILDDLKRDISQ